MSTHDCTRRDFLKAGLAGLAVNGIYAGRPFLTALQAAQTKAAGKAGGKQPNLIIFLSDDHGYADLSCMGTRGVATPHLDRLAHSGVRFTNWYCNAPICTPSRAALMSGQYPVKAGLNVNVKTGKHNTGLPLQTPTLATALKKLDYQTAIFGKWHLGANEKCWPDKRGFDEWFGTKGGCVDYYSHILYYEEPAGLPPIHDLYENGREIWENGQYFTDLITDRTVKYLDKLAAADSGRPFFIYVAYTEPHYPMHAPKKYVERFADLPPDRRIMAAKLSALDDSIGAILATLDRHGMRDDTLILFMGDNGPSREIHCWLDETVAPYYGGSAGSFRGHKGSLFEGGLRVPAIMNWPGHIPEGQVSDEVGIAMDVFPTFLKAAGGDPSQYELDGLDIMPMAAQGKPSPHETVFWEFRGQVAVRRGKWKLVLNGVDVNGVSPEDKVHLAELSSKYNDMVNVRDKYPQVTGELKALAEKWYKEVTDYYNRRWKPINVDQRSYPPYYKGVRDE